MERIQAPLPKAADPLGPDVLSDPAFSSCLRMGSDVIWANLPALSADPKLLARNRIVTAYRTDPAYVAFDMLRTALLQSLRQNKWTSVAITSPTPACGKTVLTLNLAFSLAAQKECRSVLIDLELRRRQVGKLLGLKTPPSAEDFLNGENRIEEVFIRYSDNMAIAANNRPVRFAAELLQSASAANTLKRVKQVLS